MFKPEVIDYLRQPTPTTEGLRRYAPTGRYKELPCICGPFCQENCDGCCDCAACELLAKDERYATFL
jgi:hypothetical protein